MVDVLLMHALLKAVPNKAALLIVGDVDQLSSVGPGQVLADMIASGAIPVVRVYNGDIGYVADVEPDDGELNASFDGRLVTYGFGDLDTLVPAYAATIHKSQGSEYPAVVIPVMTQNYTMLQRNLLYTGVTRGKRLVVLVGQKKAIAIAVRSVSGRRRWSKLREWLQSPGAGR
jgi:ATP-dependent exoDNAse (exonuclease V) alpha subunit